MRGREKPARRSGCRSGDNDDVKPRERGPCEVSKGQRVMTGKLSGRLRSGDERIGEEETFVSLFGKRLSIFFFFISFFDPASAEWSSDRVAFGGRQ